LNMSRLSAFKLLEWLREHPGYPVAPIFLVSSDASGYDLGKAFRLRSASFLKRPNSVENLAHLLDAASRAWPELASTSLARGS
jgi:CheY-like chemotaxis protein